MLIWKLLISIVNINLLLEEYCMKNDFTNLLLIEILFLSEDSGGFAFGKHNVQLEQEFELWLEAISVTHYSWVTRELIKIKLI